VWLRHSLHPQEAEEHWQLVELQEEQLSAQEQAIFECLFNFVRRGVEQVLGKPKVKTRGLICLDESVMTSEKNDGIGARVQVP